MMNRSGLNRLNSEVQQRQIRHTRLDDESLLVDFYELNGELGKGSFGTVYRGTCQKSGVQFAVKVIHKEKPGSSHAVKLVEREMSILKRVSHPNIIHLEEVLESSKNVFLIMELCEEGELSRILMDKNHLTESDSRHIMGNLSSAISYLHKNDIIHRDLKLDNILVTVNPDNQDDRLFIKVTDFGLSVVRDGVQVENMLQLCCGTPAYMAPEIIGNQAYSRQCDAWAMGVILYWLLAGQAPFSARDEARLYQLIRDSPPSFSETPWTSVSEMGKECVEGLLKKDPAHRLTANELLHHPWITGKATPKTSNVLDMMREFGRLVNSSESVDESAGGSGGAQPSGKPAPLLKTGTAPADLGRITSKTKRSAIPRRLKTAGTDPKLK